MDYKKIYDDLISKRRLLPPIGYSERHHIVPRSMGGTNDKSNIVSLTAREHFIAHALLAKIHGGKQWAAVALMKGKSEVSSRTYEIVRRAAAQCYSERKRGVKLTEEHKRKLRGKVRTQAHIEAIAKGRRGKKFGPISESHRQNLSKATKGRLFADETKAKMSQSAIRAHARKDGNERSLSASFAASMRWKRYRDEKRANTMHPDFINAPSQHLAT